LLEYSAVATVGARLKIALNINAIVAIASEVFIATLLSDRR